MKTTNISYAEILDFYRMLGISTEENGEKQQPDTPAGWEMPTAFDDSKLTFSNSTTNPAKSLG